MTRQTITDHQLSGKQKVAITRTKDRSLDKLDSVEDQRIEKYISDWVGNWPTVGDTNAPRLMQRSLTPKQQRKELRKLEHEEATLVVTLNNAIKQDKVDLVISTKKKLKKLKERINVLRRKIGDDKSI